MFIPSLLIRELSHMTLLQQELDSADFGRTVSSTCEQDFTAIFSSTIIKMRIFIHTVPKYECFHLWVQAQDSHVSLSSSSYQNRKLLLCPSVRIVETISVCGSGPEEDLLPWSLYKSNNLYQDVDPSGCSA